MIEKKAIHQYTSPGCVKVIADGEYVTAGGIKLTPLDCAVIFRAGLDVARSPSSPFDLQEIMQWVWPLPADDGRWEIPKPAEDEIMEEIRNAEVEFLASIEVEYPWDTEQVEC